MSIICQSRWDVLPNSNQARKEPGNELNDVEVVQELRRHKPLTLPLLDIAATMASKLTPFLMRTAARTASRAARPLVPQTRAFSISTRKQSDSLMVVSRELPWLQ